MPVQKYQGAAKEVSIQCRNCGHVLVVPCPEPVLVQTPFMTAVFIERPDASKCGGCGAIYMLLLKMQGEVTFALQLIADGSAETMTVQ